ncbi:hypothetical protein BABINDRAFT_5908 [Babjeviella inositovora NRRL Y-12698]|uniref:Endoplasmic reticulum junction formation protein lunapark n=1 Tax=Babjeviella inositovora NRRL Y-12698 TaxID=984486 RepID=A0A1E3QZG7_9ASCO|nr:uncharacterized protein BABINDRAFT_5908 [Babjeviella inositovora NRRL Y-12698]ODQ83036.1 hypothetical protein BABINDRAFT_5908 [Babjeviella inositovora NRRL Y-12698]
MAWLNIFKSRTGFDSIEFERQLKQITNSITLTERRIVSTQSNHRRFRLLFNIYSWLGYIVGVCYVLFTTKSLAKIDLNKAVGCLVSPLFIFILRFLINKYQAWTAVRLTAKLTTLREQHESKIDELKELTNFNTTHDLLRKFGDGEDYDLMAQEEAELLAQQQERLVRLKQLQEKGALDLQSFQDPSLTTKKAWSDRAMDLLLGGEEANPSSQYALICYNCKKHNGLAPPKSLPQEVEYTCPNCGAFNPQRVPISDDSPAIEATTPVEEVLALSEDAPGATDIINDEVISTGVEKNQETLRKR